MNFFELLLNSAKHGTGTVAIVNIIISFLASALLIGAILPPWLDTKRSRKTYGVTMQFFMYQTGGAICMWVNALLMICAGIGWGSPVKFFVLFSVFIVTNTISVYLNLYNIKVKKQNMKEAESRGMSEQDYYEKVLRLQLAQEKIQEKKEAEAAK